MVKTAITLRAMMAGDLPAIIRIEQASYTMPWTEATFRGLLRRRDADLVVADAGGHPVGYAVAWSVAEQCELGNVAVTADWRGLGIGRALVLEILQLAASRGVREVFLEVRPSNPVAQRLYASLGFRLVGRRKNYYFEPVEDALVMRLGLDDGDI
jgi:ribosomal-protein-alanine N-acetyltransferase